MTLTEKAKDYIADKGFDAKFGARPLKRAIQKYLEDPLADHIIDAQIDEGDKIKVDYSKKEDKITVKIVKGSKKEAEDTDVGGGTDEAN